MSLSFEGAITDFRNEITDFMVDIPDFMDGIHPRFYGRNPSQILWTECPYVGSEIISLESDESRKSIFWYIHPPVQSVRYLSLDESTE